MINFNTAIPKFLSKTSFRKGMKKLGMTRGEYTRALSAGGAIQDDDGIWVPIEWWLKNQDGKEAQISQIVIDVRQDRRPLNLNGDDNVG